MSQAEIIQVVTGSLGASGFAILFNIRGKKYIGAVIGAFLSWMLFVLLETIVYSEVIRYFVVAVVISIYAEVMARILRTPTTTFLMISLIPLIPGGALYYTMASAFEGDMYIFINNAKNTLLLAGALALGIVVTNVFVGVVNNLVSAKGIIYKH